MSSTSSVSHRLAAMAPGKQSTCVSRDCTSCHSLSHRLTLTSFGTVLLSVGTLRTSIRVMAGGVGWVGRSVLDPRRFCLRAELVRSLKSLGQMRYEFYWTSSKLLAGMTPCLKSQVS